MNSENKTQWGVGNRADSDAHSTSIVGGRVVELITGEHPHTRSDSSTYARYIGKGSGARVVGFSGHRCRLALEIEEFNYLKESDLSGDEVRRGCRAKISVEGRQVYAFGGRDLLTVMALVPAKLVDLESLLSDLYEHDSLIGRKVFWHRSPALITDVFDDGRICLVGDGCEFPPQPWDDEGSVDVVTDVLDAGIWWHRS